MSLWPFVEIDVKDMLLQLEQEVLARPAYSPNMAPSNCHLLRSLHHSLAGTWLLVEGVRKWFDDLVAAKPFL